MCGKWREKTADCRRCYLPRERWRLLEPLDHVFDLPCAHMSELLERLVAFEAVDAVEGVRRKLFRLSPQFRNDGLEIMMMLNDKETG